MEPIVGLIDGEIVVQDMAFSISTLCAWPSTPSVVFFAFDLLHSTGKISGKRRSPVSSRRVGGGGPTAIFFLE
jgi:hypothetical protein